MWRCSMRQQIRSLWQEPRGRRRAASASGRRRASRPRWSGGTRCVFTESVRLPVVKCEGLMAVMLAMSVGFARAPPARAGTQPAAAMPEPLQSSRPQTGSHVNVAQVICVVAVFGCAERLGVPNAAGNQVDDAIAETGTEREPPCIHNQPHQPATSQPLSNLHSQEQRP